jgi:hypothetical protein
MTAAKSALAVLLMSPSLALAQLNPGGSPLGQGGSPNAGMPTGDKKGGGENSVEEKVEKGVGAVTQTFDKLKEAGEWLEENEGSANKWIQKLENSYVGDLLRDSNVQTLFGVLGAVGAPLEVKELGSNVKQLVTGKDEKGNGTTPFGPASKIIGSGTGIIYGVGTVLKAGDVALGEKLLTIGESANPFAIGAMISEKEVTWTLKQGAAAKQGLNNMFTNNMVGDVSKVNAPINTPQQAAAYLQYMFKQFGTCSSCGLGANQLHNDWSTYMDKQYASGGNNQVLAENYQAIGTGQVDMTNPQNQQAAIQTAQWVQQNADNWLPTEQKNLNLNGR